jgi:molecular chaperone DnaK
VVEARNHLDSLVYNTERSLGEIKDKLSADDLGTVNTALEDAKKALESNDLTQMQTASEKLTKASHKVSEEVYKKAAAQGGAAGSEATGGAANGAQNKPDEDVVDADFEEVRDQK